MEQKTKVLVVDDDGNIRQLLRLYLEKEGFEYVGATDGVHGLKVFKETSPDIVIMDLMMPKMDGNTLCQEIRKISSIPIIMLTAKGETFDKVLGLTIGADDYVVKPFEPKEVIARIYAVLRRTSKNTEDNEKEIVLPDIDVNLSQYELTVKGEKIEMPPKELELLFFLCKNPDRVFTRDQLLDNIWGYDYFGDGRTVDVHIKRIRQKIDGKSDKWELKTVWGVGYKFELKG